MSEGGFNNEYSNDNDIEIITNDNYTTKKDPNLIIKPMPIINNVAHNTTNNGNNKVIIIYKHFLTNNYTN